MGILTFKGGVHPYDGKELSKNSPVVKYLPKGDMVYPLSQHIGAPAAAIVLAFGMPLCRDFFFGQNDSATFTFLCFQTAFTAGSGFNRGEYSGSVTELFGFFGFYNSFAYGAGYYVFSACGAGGFYVCNRFSERMLMSFNNYRFTYQRSANRAGLLFQSAL